MKFRGKKAEIIYRLHFSAVHVTCDISACSRVLVYAKKLSWCHVLAGSFCHHYSNKAIVKNSLFDEQILSIINVNENLFAKFTIFIVIIVDLAKTCVVFTVNTSIWYMFNSIGNLANRQIEKATCGRTSQF